MKKIYPLYIANLNNKQHFTFMQLAVAACALYAIIGEEFRRLVEAFRAAFEHEDDAFIHHDRSGISKRVVEADDERIRLFRHMRDFIKTFETCSVPAKLATAETLLKIIASYGGGNITGMKTDERSAALSNLTDDFERDYPEQVAALGCTEMLAALKKANQAYLDAVTERAQFDAENGMAIVATARKRTDNAYRALVEAVNSAATVDTQGELTPYIDYMNVNVRHFRMNIGQSLADMDGGTSSGGSSTDADEGGVRLKNVTFKFAGGNEQKFRLEPGAPLEAPANTPGYKWDKEIPEVVPNRNIVFREVPIEAEEGTATFHFLDHSEEEIRQAVGTALEAPQNTDGCHWDPTVPATMPAGDTQYYEVLDDAQGGEEEGGGSGSTSGGSGTGGNGGSTGSGGGQGGQLPETLPDLTIGTSQDPDELPRVYFSIAGGLTLEPGYTEYVTLKSGEQVVDLAGATFTAQGTQAFTADGRKLTALYEGAGTLLIAGLTQQPISVPVTVEGS